MPYNGAFRLNDKPAILEIQDSKIGQRLAEETLEVESTVQVFIRCMLAASFLEIVIV